MVANVQKQNNPPSLTAAKHLHPICVNKDESLYVYLFFIHFHSVAPISTNVRFLVFMAVTMKNGVTSNQRMLLCISS
jgi:hypothetical protein